MAACLLCPSACPSPVLGAPGHSQQDTLPFVVPSQPPHQSLQWVHVSFPTSQSRALTKEVLLPFLPRLRLISHCLTFTRNANLSLSASWKASRQEHCRTGQETAARHTGCAQEDSAMFPQHLAPVEDTLDAATVIRSISFDDITWQRLKFHSMLHRLKVPFVSLSTS